MKRILIILITVIPFILLLSCDKEEKYKVLSTVFDGVPHPYADSLAMPDENKKKKKSLPKRTQKATSIYLHYPYEQRECDMCHDQEGSFKLVDEQPTLCYYCHDDFTDKYEVLHGPLYVGGCTVCHNPHSSKNKFLLNRTGQALCLFCHEKQDIEKSVMHEDIGDDDCLDCHNPHGGEDKTFFR